MTRLETLTSIITDIDSNMDSNDVTLPSDLAAAILERLDEMPERLIFVGVTTMEDVGEADRMLEIIDETVLEDGEVGPYLRIMSWDPAGRHVALKPLTDANVRVTIELE